MTALTVHPQRNNVDFRVVARSFLLGERLPPANVLPAAEIERVFRRQDAIFGETYNSVYNTAIVLRAFLSGSSAEFVGRLRQFRPFRVGFSEGWQGK